jgi:2'-phosphotransferase
MARSPRHSNASANANANTSTLQGPARTIQISKSLSWLLRHGAAKERIAITADGYAKLSDVLAWHKLKAMHVEIEELVEMVQSNEKQRFGLRWDGDGEGQETGSGGMENGEHEDDGLVLSTSQNGVDKTDLTPTSAPVSSETATATPHTIALAHLLSQPTPSATLFSIRAVQGHSLKSISAPSLLTMLTPLTVPTTCVHGTFFRAWGDILHSGGLKAMGRNHVHFASGPERGAMLDQQELKLKDMMAKDAVVSGMRGDAEVLIYVDVGRAMKAGMEWYVSENGVILTEGEGKGEEVPSELQETEMMMGNMGPSQGGNANGNGIEVGAEAGQNGSTSGKRNHGRKNSRQAKLPLSRNGGTPPQKMVPMAYWDIVIGMGVGVLWERAKGVVKEVPVEMVGRGKRVGRGGGGSDRGGRVGHTRNRSSVNPKPRMRVERDDMGGFE